MKFRYPGVRSFTRDDGDLFFGRKNDEERLYKLVRLEKLVVLYGKSGYGKSSLLQAAVVPRLERETDFIPIPVRLYGYSSKGGNEITPLQRTVESIRKWMDTARSGQTSIGDWLDQLIPNENSLWYHAKKAQSATSQQRFVLVFDQFEEIFTYPEASILQFRAQLADLLYVQIPQNFRNAFDSLPSGNELDEAYTEQFFKDVEVRALFSIRSDYMHLMNRMKDFLPQILRHCYELDALTIEQAKEAIVEPAHYTPEKPALRGMATRYSPLPPVGSEVLDVGITPNFAYTSEALQLLLSFLSKDGREKIESFQLQLICRHIEEKFVRSLNDLLIEPEDFGKDAAKRTEYLQDVNRNYYQECIGKLSLDKQPVARLIVENELVTVEDKRRITADAGMLVSRYRVQGASPELLEALKATYLLRAEATTRGEAYELSHDALVEPILNARKEREELEARRLAEKRRRRAIIITSFALLVAAGAVILALWALGQKREADTQRKAAIEALEKYQQEQHAKEKERADKDKLKFEDLDQRAEAIIKADGCPMEIFKEMQAIAEQYPDNTDFRHRAQKVNKAIQKCQ